MVNYRRCKIDSPDALYFLTIVTRDRRCLFSNSSDRALVVRTMQKLSERFALDYDAWVLLPDHLHWLLCPGEADYSKVVFAFKRWVGAEYKKQGRLSTGSSLWQHRFWEHSIRDDDDYRRCVEYIHYNPVKHGLVHSPADWRYSSFREFVAKGLYPQDWAAGNQIVVAGAEWD